MCVYAPADCRSRGYLSPLAPAAVLRESESAHDGHESAVQWP